MGTLGGIMPIPRGAHQVHGEPNRVRLASGEIVTRSHARSLGARELGFKSEYAYRNSGQASKDDKYVRAMLRSEQGRHVLDIAKQQGKSVSEVRQQLLAARNAQPHHGRPGGEAYYAFMDEYELYDYDEWMDY